MTQLLRVAGGFRAVCVPCGYRSTVFAREPLAAAAAKHHGTASTHRRNLRRVELDAVAERRGRV